ncbi:hypothetical protein AALO_G00131040, partial [Alosa alosa]
EGAAGLSGAALQDGGAQRGAALGAHEALDHVHVGQHQGPVAAGRQPGQVRAGHLQQQPQQRGQRSAVQEQEALQADGRVAAGDGPGCAVSQQREEQDGERDVRSQPCRPAPQLLDGAHLQSAGGQREDGRNLGQVGPAASAAPQQQAQQRTQAQHGQEVAQCQVQVRHGHGRHTHTQTHTRVLGDGRSPRERAERTPVDPRGTAM